MEFLLQSMTMKGASMIMSCACAVPEPLRKRINFTVRSSYWRHTVRLHSLAP